MAIPRKTVTRTEEVKLTKYLVKTSGGRGGTEEQIIEIPEMWKLTFASVNPAAAHDRSMNGYCLRIYEGDRLRAVFDSVISFRDVSIPLVRQIKTEMGSAKWEKDSVGNFKEEREVKLDFQLLAENIELD